MDKGQINDVALQLEARGHDAGHLQELQEELDSLTAPPGLWTRMTTRVRETAQQQWLHIIGELQESGEAIHIIRRAMIPGEVVSPEEADKVRSQLFDLLRVVPASFIAVTNAAIPIPGSSVVTPWLLHRMGFMPSRWREAHLIDKLEAEVKRLQDEGLDDEAGMLMSICTNIEVEARQRDRIETEAATLTFWDKNRNGTWDEDERSAYSEAVHSLAREWSANASTKRWFLLHEGTVVGPIRIQEMDTQQVSPSLLVCLDGQSGWVSLIDVMKTSKSDD